MLLDPDPTNFKNADPEHWSYYKLLKMRGLNLI